MNRIEVIEHVLSGAGNEKFIERELETIEGDDIRLAVLACAVPLSFDARLASELFAGSTVGTNGCTAKAFKSVTSLSFINRDLSGKWRFTEEARKFCLNKLKHSNNSALDSINEELKNFYERVSGLSTKERDKQKTVSSLFLKAHHKTNVERLRSEGFDEIDNIINEIEDQKIKNQAGYIIYQLCERYDSVYDYRAENYYFYEGMRLYNSGERQEALRKLQPVADSELINLRVAIACHLTGLILQDRIQQDRIRIGKYFEKSLELREKIGDLKGQAHVLLSYGDFLADKEYPENHKDAKDYYEKSLKLRERLDDLEGQAYVLHSFGKLLAQYPKKNKEAEACYNKSIDICKTIKRFDHQIKVLTSFCAFYRENKLYEKAKEKIHEALNILKGFPDDRKSIAMSHSELGHIYRALGRFEDAIRNYEIALDAEKKEKHQINIRRFIADTKREKATIESAREKFSIQGRQALAGLDRQQKLQVMRGIFKEKGLSKDLFDERHREREKDE